MSNKWLISIIYKELLQLNNSNKTTQLKMGRGLEQMFLLKRCTNGQEARGKVLNETYHWGKQIKPTPSCLLTPIRMALSESKPW
jgi:hypothetical protein